jgi:integrase/recombinase XerD
MVTNENFAEWRETFTRYCRLQKKADSTIKSYWGGVGHFIAHFRDMDIARMHSKDIADYILGYDSARTMEQKKYGIGLFYGVVFGQWKKLDWIPLPKRENKIPEILIPEECYRVFSCVKNTKHKALLQLTYACALRRSELLNLKIRHIDGSANRLFVEQSKGKKDRVVPIPKDTLLLLRSYFKEYFPSKYDKNDFLFSGQYGQNDNYSSASVYAILGRALRAAGINKRIKLHSLRHSRATHWHNSGVMSLRDIADLLGHKDTKTTEIYLHTGDENLQEKVANADSIIQSKINRAPTPHNTFTPILTNKSIPLHL